MTAPLILLLVIVLAVLGSLAALLRRVPPGHVGVRTRMGRVEDALPPGLHLVLPGDKVARVSLAQQTLRVRRRALPAANGGEVMAEATVPYRVVDAFRTANEIGDPALALEQLVLTVLRGFLEEREPQDAVEHPGTVTEQVRDVLARACPPWGVEPGPAEVVLELPG